MPSTEVAHGQPAELVAQSASSRPNQWWSDKKRLELVQTYVVMGNLRLAAATLNIPEVTARRWKAQPWWKEAELEIRKGGKLALSGKLSDLVTKVFSSLEDRIENGDWVHNPRTGKLERKPVSAAVINNIMKDTINQSVSLEKAGMEEAVSQEGIEARLEKLRDELLSAAGKLRNKPLTIQGEVLDVQFVQGNVSPSGREGLTNAQTIDPSDQGLVQAPGSQAHGQG